MIRLHRNASPAFLSPANVKALTEAFSSTSTSVWNRADIKETLSLIGNGKCAYCEAKLGVEAMYLEVEHFRHKDKFPKSVVEWSNLLPSCRRCNGKKATHNVEDEPIINPFDVDPKLHLSFQLYRIESKTDLGRKTIDVLDLNHRSRAVIARFQIGEATLTLIDTCAERVANYLESKTSVRRTKLLSSVEGLLDECQVSAPYASTSATVLNRSSRFQEIMESLKSLDLWSDEFKSKFQSAIEIALPEG